MGRVVLNRCIPEGRLAGLMITLRVRDELEERNGGRIESLELCWSKVLRRLVKDAIMESQGNRERVVTSCCSQYFGDVMMMKGITRRHKTQVSRYCSFPIGPRKHQVRAGSTHLDWATAMKGGKLQYLDLPSDVISVNALASWSFESRRIENSLLSARFLVAASRLRTIGNCLHPLQRTLFTVI